MYDNHINQKVFRRLKGRIVDLWYATNDVNVEQLKRQIQDALNAGDISGTQYDNLVGELLEFGYTM